MSNKNRSLPEKFVEECLANGRKLKETANETIRVTVIQGDREDGRKFGLPFGRELFDLDAKINPQSDIDDEGYVTQAWFRMPRIQRIQERDGAIWALMKPSRFEMPDPVVYFEAYIDDTEARLLPHPDF